MFLCWSCYQTSIYHIKWKFFLWIIYYDSFNFLDSTISLKCFLLVTTRRLEECDKINDGSIEKPPLTSVQVSSLVNGSIRLLLITLFLNPPSSGIASCVGTAGTVMWHLHLMRPCCVTLGWVLIWVPRVFDGINFFLEVELQFRHFLCHCPKVLNVGCIFWPALRCCSFYT